MPSKKKKFNARFPPARIKKIMQTDEDVGKVAAPVPVIISRALELFIESLVTKTSEITYSRNAKTLTCSHIKATINSEKRFDFLKDLVANIPDVLPEEEETNGEHIKPKIKKPRKPREKKLKKEEELAENPQSTDSDDESQEDDEETDDADSAEDLSIRPSGGAGNEYGETSSQYAESNS